MREHDIVILGAGISGLSVAHYALQRGLSTLVIEKAERVGGSMHTCRPGDDAPGYWLELGAHTCYNSYSNLIGILTDLGMIDRLVKREKAPYRMLVGNELRSIPSQINFLELAISVPRILFTDKAGKSVRSYYSRIVGPRNFERVFSHLFNAVPSQDASGFPADILFKKRPRRKDILRSFTLTNGLQSVTDAIADRPGLSVETGTKVIGIELSGERFVTATDRAGRCLSRYLAVATPVTEAARLVGPVNPELADALAGIGMVSIESLGVALGADLVSVERIAGIVPREDSFFSVVSRDTVPAGRYRGFTFHFKPGQADRAAKLQRIGEVLGAPADAAAVVAERHNLLPVFSTGHRDRVRRIDDLTAGTNLLLTGNYLGGVAIEDCVSRSKHEVGRIEG